MHDKRDIVFAIKHVLLLFVLRMFVLICRYERLKGLGVNLTCVVWGTLRILAMLQNIYLQYTFIIVFLGKHGLPFIENEEPAIVQRLIHTEMGLTYVYIFFSFININ